jgi:hypothetical protein
MHWIKRPGFHQIEGDPQSGKTTYAILQAVGRERVAWVGAPLDDPFGLFNSLDFQPDIFIEAPRIGSAFDTLKMLQGHADFIILDSLAGLMPDHPHGRNIARDVERLWFTPTIPILIINQRRYPVAPGGSLWRGALQSNRHMIRLCECPLVSWISKPYETLTWGPGAGPIIKGLSEVEAAYYAQVSGSRRVFVQKRQSTPHKRGIAW